MHKLFMIVVLSVSGLAKSEDIFTNEFEALVATRINSISIKDPHIYKDGLGGCTDYTGFINDFVINSSFNNDSDNDGYLDLNVLLQFKTDQPDYMVTKSIMANMIDGSCPDPLFSAPCEVTQVVQSDIGTEGLDSGVCLQPIPGTTSGYSPAVINTEAPCFVTDETDVILSVSGIDIPLQAYRQAARYQGALSLDQGLHTGFISEADAMNVVIPESFPFVGGDTLFDLLAGGGSCSTADDRDTGPDGITSGWWFYFNSESDLVELH